MSRDSMQALVLEHPGMNGLVIRRRPIPEPGMNEVLIQIRACGLGRTVVNKIRGLSVDQLPRVPGHEATGDIVAVGEGVEGLELGTRVMVYYYVTCGACRYCWQGREPLCMRTADGHGSFRIGEDVDGALAEYVKLPARNVIPLPDGLGYVEATTAPDAIATPLHICRRVGLAPSERILIVGAAGGVGVHLVQIARLLGAEPVAVDLPDKLGALERYGAQELVDATDPAWHRKLVDGIDVAVDLVGTPSTLEASYATLNRGGRLALLTVDRDVEFPIAPRRMVLGERTVTGSRYASHAEVAHAAKLLADGIIKAVVSRVVPLDQAGDVLGAIDRFEFSARGAMVIS